MAKTQSIKQQAIAQRQRVFEIAEKLEEAQVFERLSQQQRDQLDSMYRGYQRDYGAVAYQYWLRAVVRSMRPNIKNLNQVVVHELLSRSNGDTGKILYLQIMARQMGADVTITNNRVARPARKRARKKTAA
uniref:hypothetical protein n=1 Tax=Limnohabitans sp. TaxID=1907725 RepID=UPI0040477BF3